MTDEKKNIPRSRSNTTSFHDPAQIRKQAERRAQSIQQPDFSSMTSEEIQQQFYEMQVKQIETALEKEQLRNKLEEKKDQAELFSIVNENMLDMVALTDMEGNFTFAGKFHEILGYEPDYLIGKNVMDFVHPEDFPRILEAFNEFVASGHPRRVEYRYRCEDGTYLWLETIGNFFGDESGAPQTIVFSSRNITERKQAEEALQERLSYEQLLSRVSVLAMETDDLYVFQNKCLKAMGVTLDLSRIYIFEHHHETDTMDNTFEWVAEGVSPQKDELQGVSAADIPWWMKVLKSNQVINFADIEAIPDEGVKTILRPQRILSILVVPLFTAGQYYGFLGFDDCVRHREWSDTDAELLQAVGRIITGVVEQKRAEEALKESEERFSKAFRSSPAPQVISDITTGEFIDVNDRWVDMLGYSREQSIGRTSKEVGIWADPGERDRIIQKLQENTFFNDEPVEFRTSNGSTVYALWSAETVTLGGCNVMLSMIYDETERKRAEDALRQRESLLQRIFDILPIGLWFADKNGRLLRGNPAGVEIWGAEPLVDPSTYGVFKARRYLSGEPITPDTWALARTIGRGVTILDELLEIEAFDGKKKIILNSTAPVLDEEGNIEGAVVINQDVTEREQLQSQLNQAQKMESVGRLAGGVAHDFNNKLSIINGYAELAMETIAPSDPFYETVQEIHTAGKKSADIVRQLLAFARQQTISPVQLDLNDTISGMLKMLQRLIGENIHLEWHAGKNLWPVKIDPSQIDQIMANLAVNSRDAISDVGKLTIETNNIMVDQEYCGSNPEANPGQYVVLAVSDDGCGIEEEIKEQLFDPYFTTKEIGKGTGLGLPTIYGIVKQNNGFINVYSEPGEGTIFKLYFPSCEAEKSSVQSAKESSEQIPTGMETILVVEDEKTILQMSKQMLERLGYTVQTAGNPSEALQISEKYHGAIDLLVTDVIMPDMNGRDLSSQLLKSHSALKTLYMSGYTADVIAHRGVLDEGVQFIQKPFSLRDLAVKVREVLEQERVTVFFGSTRDHPILSLSVNQELPPQQRFHGLKGVLGPGQKYTRRPPGTGTKNVPFIQKPFSLQESAVKVREVLEQE